jgi:hypothetical protein
MIHGMGITVAPRHCCSGDHDLLVPHLGTQAWVRSLNFSIVDDWRAWHLGGQSAGWVFLCLPLFPSACFDLIIFLVDH